MCEFAHAAVVQRTCLQKHPALFRVRSEAGRVLIVNGVSG
jgi:hypothetical protein